MRKSVKKKWVEALRSKKYKQGKNQLKRGDKFCCLGVLCDLYRKTRKRGKWKMYLGSYVFYAEKDHHDSVLPKGVFKWAGLPDNNPLVPWGKARRSLAALNDDEVSFDKIAAVIEEQF